MRLAIGWSVFLLGCAGIASADEHAAVREGLGRVAPTAQIESIHASRMPGISEVIVGGEVLFVSNDGKFVIQGRVLDTVNRSDLTDDAEKTIRAAALKQIGPEKRLSFPAANPIHHVTIFTDVDCGYCRKLHQDIAKYNDAGISVDYLFFPRAGIPSASFDKAAFIWCADDRKQAMNQSMTQAGIAYSKVDCANPVSETYALAQRVSKTGTPTILADDGSLLGNYLTVDDLNKRLVSMQTTTAP